MKTRLDAFKSVLAATALAALGTVALSGTANATGSGGGSGEPQVGQSPEVVFAKPATPITSKASDGATFYETGPIGHDTVVIMPEVYEAAGLSYEDVEDITTLQKAEEAVGAKAPERLRDAGDAVALSSCGGTVTGVYGYWSSPVASNCSVAGHSGYKLYYSWSVASGTNQSAGVQGLGYYVGYNGSELGVWSKYYGIGVGSSGGAAVPWGNVWSVPKVRAQSTILVHIAQVSFSH